MTKVRAVLSRWFHKVVDGSVVEPVSLPPLVSGSPPPGGADLRVEPGSTLDAMAELPDDAAAGFVDAVLADLASCADNATLAEDDCSREQMLEEIHSLKNACAATGSPALLGACDQLRVDAARDKNRASIAARYAAISRAAIILVEDFSRSRTGRASPISDANV